MRARGREQRRIFKETITSRQNLQHILTWSKARGSLALPCGPSPWLPAAPIRIHIGSIYLSYLAYNPSRILAPVDPLNAKLRATRLAPLVQSSKPHLAPFPISRPQQISPTRSMTTTLFGSVYPRIEARDANLSEAEATQKFRVPAGGTLVVKVSEPRPIRRSKTEGQFICRLGAGHDARRCGGA